VLIALTPALVVEFTHGLLTVVQPAEAEGLLVHEYDHILVEFACVEEYPVPVPVPVETGGRLCEIVTQRVLVQLSVMVMMEMEELGQRVGGEDAGAVAGAEAANSDEEEEKEKEEEEDVFIYPELGVLKTDAGTGVGEGSTTGVTKV
jgi:hypothetical protein